MVKRQRRGSKKLDPVAETLSQLDGQSANAIEWLDSRRELNSMRRKASFCFLSGWLLLTISAIVSCVVAFVMSDSIRGIFEDQYESDAWSLVTVVWAPWVLALTAIVLLIGGLIGFMSGRLPGLKSTVSAIDWSTASEAVTRLLMAGCTYPQAFRTAADGMPNNESRRWLISAAQRVESGNSPISPDQIARGDAAVLELLLGAGPAEPQLQWRLVAEHFLDVARRRLVLLTQSLPVISTVLAGFLVWVSISATLGWMWKTVGGMINGFGY